MKRSELLVSVALVPLDFVALLAAAWSAFSIRHLPFIRGIRPLLFDLTPGAYLQTVSGIIFVWILLFAWARLYRFRSTDSALVEVRRIFLGCLAGFVFITILVFLRGELFSSRFIILVGCLLAIVYVSVVRLLVHTLQRVFFRHGFAAHRLAIIGKGRVAETLVKDIRDNPGWGYAIVGFMFPAMENLTQLQQLVNQEALDEILFVDAGSSAETRQFFFNFAEEHHVTFRYAPDILAWPIGTPTADFDLGVPVIEVPETTIVGWGRIRKRVVDIVGSASGLVLLSPVFFLVAMAVGLESGLPIVYRSQRIGRGRSFTFYKFRTMKLEFCTGEQYGGKVAAQFEQKLIEEKNIRQGPVPKITDDPRWTKVGKWLRRTSLDELPQLWNVLKGDMSLVGPRPHFPREVAHYERHHKKVLAVKPGITGLAQVSGRSDLDFDDEVRLDRYYIEHWSLWLDLRILVRTVGAVLASRQTL